MQGQERVKPNPTLADFTKSIISEFNRRRLDDSGFNPMTLDRTVARVLSASGLDGSAILTMVKAGISLDAEAIAVAAREAEWLEPEERDFATAGLLLVEEICQTHPDVKAENRSREDQAIGAQITGGHYI